MTDASFESAYASVLEELRVLMPSGRGVVDAHTHLGNDEDGMSLGLGTLLEQLDQLDPSARACVFALHDPERRPAYRRPNDRVLEWARAADGRLYPFCRLDPGEDPVGEAERCLARGARGIKLHPRAQAFGFGDSPAAEAIFECAGEAGVPILIHAGRGMPTMAPLADLALRHPEVALVLAHGGTADMGVFAARLADHPRVVYDTACMALDLIELLARVPVERVVFGSDPPYGRPAAGLFQTLRVARYAGLGADDVALLSGGTITALLEGRELARATPPRVPQVRRVSGRLSRITNHVLMRAARDRSARGGPRGVRAHDGCRRDRRDRTRRPGLAAAGAGALNLAHTHGYRALAPTSGIAVDADAGAGVAHFDGPEPCSYLLDPAVNYVRELPLGGEDPLGLHALRFTGNCPESGRSVELVTLPDGCAFDLLGISR